MTVTATDADLYEDNPATMAGVTGINLEERPDIFQEGNNNERSEEEHTRERCEVLQSGC